MQEIPPNLETHTHHTSALVQLPVHAIANTYSGSTVRTYVYLQRTLPPSLSQHSNSPASIRGSSSSKTLVFFQGESLSLE